MIYHETHREAVCLHKRTLLFQRLTKYVSKHLCEDEIIGIGDEGGLATASRTNIRRKGCHHVLYMHKFSTPFERSFSLLNSISAFYLANRKHRTKSKLHSAEKFHRVTQKPCACLQASANICKPHASCSPIGNFRAIATTWP